MSETPEQPYASLQGLLDHLETKADDGLARLTFTGRALSKSEENLHLAVASGVLAIPLSEIESVAPLIDARPDVVSVAVRNADRVRHLLKVEQLQDSYTLGDPLPGAMLGYESAKRSAISATANQESYTKCANPPRDDACDDVVLGRVIF